MKISGERIDFLLAKRNMTSGKLSELSGVSRQSISTIKTRGTCRPDSAAKIAKGLGVDIEELFKEVQP